MEGLAPGGALRKGLPVGEGMMGVGSNQGEVVMDSGKHQGGHEEKVRKIAKASGAPRPHSLLSFHEVLFSAFCLLCSAPIEGEAENTVEKTLLKSKQHLLRSLEYEASL